MFGRDKSARFKDLVPTPGPGEYDPNFDIGFKADMVSGFKGSGRFRDGIDDDGSGSMSSPRRLPPRAGSRGGHEYTSARIKELELELRAARTKIIELQAIIKEANMTPEQKGKLQLELRDLKIKISNQKGLTAQTQREKAKLESDVKRLQSQYAYALEKAKKTEDARRFSAARVTEITTEVQNLEKKVSKGERKLREKEQAYTEEIEKLRGLLNKTQTFVNTKGESVMEIEQDLNDALELVEVQQEQIAAMEDEIDRGKAASEQYAAKSLTELVLTKIELSIVTQQANDNSELIAKLRAEIEELKKTVERITRERDELASVLAESQKENTEKANKIENLQSLLSGMEMELRQRDELIASLRTLITEHENKNEKSAESLQIAALEIEQLKKDLVEKLEKIENFHSVIESAKREIEEKDGEIENLNVNLKETNMTLREKESKINTFEKLSESQLAEIDSLTEKVSIALSEKKAKVAEIEKQKKEEKSLRCSLADKERMVSDLEKLLDSSEKKLIEEQSNRSNLQVELKSIRAQYTEKSEEASELSQKVTALDISLKEKSEESTSRALRIKELSEDLSKSQLEVDTGKETIKNLLESVKELEAMVTEKNGKISNLTEMLDSVSAECVSLQEEVEKTQICLSSAENVISDRDQEIAKLKNEVLMLSAKAATADIFNSVLVIEVREMEVAKVCLESKVQEIERELKESKAESADMALRISGLEAEKSAIQSEVEKTKNMNSEIDMEKKGILKALAEAEARENELKKEKQEIDGKLISKIQNLKKEMENDRKKLKDALSAKEKLSDSLKSATKESEEKQKSIKKLKESYEKRLKESSELNSEAKELQRQAQAAEASLREKSALVQSLQAELQKSQNKSEDKLAALQKEHASLKEKLGERDSKIKKLDGELASLRHAVESKNKELNDLKANHETILKQVEIEGKQNLEKQKRKYESQMKSLKDQLPQSAPAHTTSNDADYIIEKLKQELADAKKKIVGYEKDNQHNYEEEMSKLKEQLNNALKRESHAVMLLEKQRRKDKDESTMSKEMKRLAQENILLVSKTEQLSADLKNLISASKYGHHNSNQKIQYHLKLKQELEEMRRQCASLIKDKFKLEQAIRYMHARAEMLLGNCEYDVTGTKVRDPITAVAQDSTKTNVNLATPGALNHMKWSSRSKTEGKAQAPYKARKKMVHEITETQIETTNEANALIATANHTAPDPTTLPEKDDALVLTLLLTPTSMSSPAETKIVNKIKSIIGGNKAEKSKFLNENTTSF